MQHASARKINVYAYSQTTRENFEQFEVARYSPNLDGRLQNFWLECKNLIRMEAKKMLPPRRTNEEIPESKMSILSFNIQELFPLRGNRIPFAPANCC